MAGRIRSIIVEIGGDTTKLQTALERCRQGNKGKAGDFTAFHRFNHLFVQKPDKSIDYKT